MWAAKGLRVSLRQLTTLIVCFSESIPPLAAAQLAGVSRQTAGVWYKKIRSSVVKRTVQLQKSFGKQGGKNIISEADEGSVASGPIPSTPGRQPRFSYTRIIALLVRGSRKLIIEMLPEVLQTYRLTGTQKTMSGGTICFKGKKWVPPGPPSLSRLLVWSLQSLWVSQHGTVPVC